MRQKKPQKVDRILDSVNFISHTSFNFSYAAFPFLTSILSTRFTHRIVSQSQSFTDSVINDQPFHQIEREHDKLYDQKP